MGPTADITGLLVAVSNGEEAARTRLIEAVYDELRRLARGYLRRERPDLHCTQRSSTTPSSLKRGAGARVPLLDIAAGSNAVDVDVLALDAALEKLSESYPRQGQLVELRFFGGLSVAETAAALDVAPITVKRDWALARAWLHREMRGQPV